MLEWVECLNIAAAYKRCQFCKDQFVGGYPSEEYSVCSVPCLVSV